MTQTTTGNEDFLTASLHHRNLQVDTSDPTPRPMIAIRAGVGSRILSDLFKTTSGAPATVAP